jgi:hypothetical protein
VAVAIRVAVAGTSLVVHWPPRSVQSASTRLRRVPCAQACVFGRYDLVMVDEAHDLTLAQIEPISPCACAKVLARQTKLTDEPD